MFRKSLRLALAVAAVLLSIGIIACGERSTLLTQNWGRSYESAKYSQFLNPDAAWNLDPVTGLDGIATSNTVNKYDASFSEKKDVQTTHILKLE